MKALILAGGFGTRLRPLSCTRPKTLFPIVNKPLLQWIFEGLSIINVQEAILAVNKQTEFLIKQNRIPKCGLKVKYSRDPPQKPLGTAGPIKRAEKLIGTEESFLCLNGDIFTNLSYKEIVENHNEDQAVATIALYKVEDPSRYGVADLGPDNRIKRFIEKPAKEETPTNLINAGIYVLSPKIFNYIPKGRAVSMEREVFPKLAKEQVLFGHVAKGLWRDIGKPEEYLQTNRLLLDGLADGTIKEKPFSARRFELKKPVAIERSVSIGEKTVIGPYAVLGKRVFVGKNVHIRDSVILPNSSIDDFSSITGAMIGEGVSIGKKVQIKEGCIIGDQTRIRDGVKVAAQTTICPGKEIVESILKTTIIC